MVGFISLVTSALAPFCVADVGTVVVMNAVAGRDSNSSHIAVFVVCQARVGKLRPIER